MKHGISKLLLLILLTSSCASIVNRRYYEMTLMSNPVEAKIFIHDTMVNTPARVRVKRSGEDLQVTMAVDSASRNFVLKACANPWFVFGNLFWIELAPIGYLVDLTNPKRFGYGKKVRINFYDTSDIILTPLAGSTYKFFHTSFPAQKGDINLKISFPWINQFYLHPKEESTKSNTGFWGLAAGVEYYYSKTKFISLTGSLNTDFFLPVPAAVDFSGEHESMQNASISLTDNFKFSRFTLGYGLNYAHRIWALTYIDRFDPPPPTRDPATRRSHSLGLDLNAALQVARGLSFGIIYQPDIYRLYPTHGFNYQHLISFYAAVGIPLHRSK